MGSVEPDHTKRHARRPKSLAQGENLFVVEIPRAGGAKHPERGISCEGGLRTPQLEPHGSADRDHSGHVAAQRNGKPQ